MTRPPSPYGRARRRDPVGVPALDPVADAIGRILDAERRHRKPLPNVDRVVLLEIGDRVRPDTLAVVANAVGVAMWSGVTVGEAEQSLRRLVKRGYLTRSRAHYGEKATQPIRWTITP